MDFGDINEFQKELDVHKGKIVIEAYKMDRDKVVVAFSLLSHNRKKSEIIEIKRENKDTFVSILEKNMDKVLDAQRPLVEKVIKEIKETNI